MMAGVPTDEALAAASVTTLAGGGRALDKDAAEREVGHE